MKICSKCNKENDNVTGKYCVFCGGKLIDKKFSNTDYKENEVNLIDDKKKSKKGLIITIIIAIILGLTCIYCFYKIYSLSSNNKKLEKTISTLRSSQLKLSAENSEYQVQNHNYKLKIDFFDENIVFVIDGYGRYYYTYDQMEQVTQGKKSYSYWAYNKEQAKSLGYKAFKD